MVSTISRGESIYSFRAGKVVLRWLRFFSPTLANRAVLRVLLAMLKSAYRAVSILWMETTAAAALLAWGAG
jgi:hypothetical protein